MSDFDQAIADAQAQAEAAAAQAAALDEAGVTPEQVAEAYAYETEAYDSTAGASSSTGYGEATGEGGGSGASEIDQYYADQYAQPPAPAEPEIDEDALLDYAWKQGLLTVVGQAVAYTLGKALGFVWQVAFTMESDQPATQGTGITVYGYQAWCEGYHDEFRTKWYGPARRTESQAKEDLEAHERGDVHLDTMTPEGQGGGYQ